MQQAANYPSIAPQRCTTRVGLLTILLAALAPVAATGQNWQDTSVIEQTATDYVASAIELPPGARVTLKAGNLDTRLRLPRCEAPLQAFASPGSDLRRGGTVGVRCTAGKRWKIYVPVRVSVMSKVVVARHALARGAIVSAQDVELIERDVASLPSGYLSDIARLEGQSLRRGVLPGNLITPAMLARANAIQRGQRVTLLAAGAALSIRMAGTAMSNGGLGERIAVKNLSSGRTVEGIVRSPETVEILQY